MPDEFDKHEYVKVNQKKFDLLMGLIGELTVNRNVLENECKKLGNTVMSEIMEQDRRVVNNIHEIISKIKMSLTKELFTFLIDKTREEFKEIEFATHGEDIELDINILERIQYPLLDALLSILRNVKDKETNDLNNKTSIKISAKSENNSVMMEFEIPIIPSEITSFESVNKDIENIEHSINLIGGSAFIAQGDGKTTLINIVIPKILTSGDALIVCVGNQRFAILIDDIETITNCRKEAIKTTEGREVIEYRKHIIPLIRLSKRFNIKADDSSEGFVVIAKSGENTAGLFVDALIGQVSVAIKEIPKLFDSNTDYYGTTLLSDSKPVLILNTGNILRK